MQNLYKVAKRYFDDMSKIQENSPSTRLENGTKY